MSQNTVVCILIFAVALLVVLPLAVYMNKVYKGRKSKLDFLKPLENLIFRICRVDSSSKMNWKQYLFAMGIINAIWLLFAFLILQIQAGLFLNPALNPSVQWSLTWNSAISFLTSTNLQYYSGESGATYLSQMGVLMFLQFVIAVTSLSVTVAIVRGLPAKKRTSLGNSYSDVVLSLTRILLPLCIIAAISFVRSRVPMMFDGLQKIITLRKETIKVATGPVAGFILIIRIIWIAGLFIEKQYVPRSSGTLKMGGATLGVVLFAAIILLNMLSFFPALMRGPISDHFLLK
ncbi:MAG: potassium-transporting ATPase subunit KdpA [Ferruginibacter sp.]|nr:potassium-transporting ATPase subunit KdpA [Ferruginibacter sp.]